MQGSLQRTGVVVGTSNYLVLSRCLLANYVKELDTCCTCSTINFPHSTNQITDFAVIVVVS